MTLEIITPDKKVYEGEVALVHVPGTKGQFQILKDHAPIISTLQKGKVKIVETSGSTVDFEIMGGVIEVLKNNVIILAEAV